MNVSVNDARLISLSARGKTHTRRQSIQLSSSDTALTFTAVIHSVARVPASCKLVRPQKRILAFNSCPELLTISLHTIEEEPEEADCCAGESSSTTASPPNTSDSSSQSPHYEGSDLSFKFFESDDDRPFTSECTKDFKSVEREVEQEEEEEEFSPRDVHVHAIGVPFETPRTAPRPDFQTRRNTISLCIPRPLISKVSPHSLSGHARQLSLPTIPDPPRPTTRTPSLPSPMSTSTESSVSSTGSPILSPRSTTRRLRRRAGLFHSPAPLFDATDLEQSTINTAVAIKESYETKEDAFNGALERDEVCLGLMRYWNQF